mmetsp:Transcript_20586/g.44711  ORF Transcript_20586/g.44711 Transcript_20586/m.44711 type:complete len:344 (+) Transcript_20586:3-1034(+)
MYNIIVLSALICTLCSAFSPHSTANIVVERSSSDLLRSKSMQSPEHENGGGARLAFLGNSILYYNDCPRFLVNLGKGSVEYQDSCLRGGANLSELWDIGNGMMRHGFATEAAKIGKSEDGSDLCDVGSPTVGSLLGCTEEKDDEKRERWDFVIFNDHTQGPARLASREATQVTLVENYLPLILENQAKPIIIETAAYRFHEINNSKDLGSTHEFQRRVQEGIQSYLQTLQPKLPQSLQPRMAPVGTAYLHVHDNNHALWEKLFDPYDNFHPSPSGTFLQGCVLHCTLFGSLPPLPKTEEEIAGLWKDARMMHNVKTGENRALPSVEEAGYLWNVAKKICDSAL